MTAQAPQPNRGRRRLITLYALLCAVTLLGLTLGSLLNQRMAGEAGPPAWLLLPIGLLLTLFCGHAIYYRQSVVGFLRAIYALSPLRDLHSPTMVVIIAPVGLHIGVLFSITGLVALVRGVSASLR